MDSQLCKVLIPNPVGLGIFCCEAGCEVRGLTIELLVLVDSALVVDRAIEQGVTDAVFDCHSV